MSKASVDKREAAAPATPEGQPRMRPCVVVHYHEVGLKGRNRPFFLSTLEKNLRRATTGLGVKEVERMSGRILLWLEPDASWERLRTRIARVFGVVNFARGYALQPELDALVRGVAGAAAGGGRVRHLCRARAAGVQGTAALPRGRLRSELGAAVQDGQRARA